MSTYPVVDWNGLYGEGWSEDIVPEAFSHPAKYSRALIRHIYQYLIDNGLVKRGDRIIDPFGGVALGALDAQLQGLHWVGCELEPKFVELGNRNLDLWRSRYAPHFPRWGSARLVQGDSRRLAEVVGGAMESVVSSPPFSETISSMKDKSNFDFSVMAKKRTENYGRSGSERDLKEQAEIDKNRLMGKDYGQSPGQLGAMPSGDVNAILSSPPYAEALNNPSNDMESSGVGGPIHPRNYGESEGQLGAMPSGDFGGVIASPPFQGVGMDNNSDNGVRVGMNTQVMRTNRDANIAPGEKARELNYGTTDGQLGSMPPGDVNAVIASPPFGSHDSAGPESLHTRTDESAKAMLNAQGWNGGGQTSEDNLATLPEDNFDAVIASPPFIQTTGGTNVTSPEGPLADPSLISRHSAGNAAMHGYGESEGNIQAMKEGDVDAIIASPPFAGVVQAQDPNYQSAGEGHEPRRSDYGATPGQLAHAPEGRFDSVLSSPPYEGGQVGRGEVGNRKSTGGSDGQPDKVLDAMQHGYSDTPENLGNSEGDTFWSAALTIVSECYKLLAPGSVAVWICKDYVRNKKRVPFSDQWRQLCEKVGFTTLTEVHAWVVEDNGTQLGMMETEDKHHKTERKSFFRRLAEKKGSPRIDWETVWIMRK